MPDILIRHADVVTLDGEGRVLFDADVAVSGPLIVAVGDTPVGFAADETIDAAGHILLPGLFNAHTHSPLALARGSGRQNPFAAWITGEGEPHEMDAEDVYWGAALAAIEMIRGGTVGFADHYFHMDQVGRVAVEGGLRANLAWVTFGLERGEVGADLQGISDFVRDWDGAGDGRIKTMLGPYSAQVCTPQFIARTVAVAARLGVGIHMNLAETPDEVERCQTMSDLTPVQMLLRNGVLDLPLLAAHGIHLGLEDMEALAAAEATVVSCPTAQSVRALGLTLAPVLLAAGVNVALGTDGYPGAQTLSLWQEARQTALAHRLQMNDPNALPGDLVLRMATQNGARALGFPLSGQIAPRYNADLILVDCRTPRLTPHLDPVETLIYGAQDGDVTDVMVAGRWLMRRRRLLTLDEERILYEVRRRYFPRKL